MNIVHFLFFDIAHMLLKSLLQNNCQELVKMISESTSEIYIFCKKVRLQTQGMHTLITAFALLLS